MKYMSHELLLQGSNSLYIIFWLRWVFVAVPGLSSCSERGLLFVVVRGLLIAVASLAAERGL